MNEIKNGIEWVSFKDCQMNTDRSVTSSGCSFSLSTTNLDLVSIC